MRLRGVSSSSPPPHSHWKASLFMTMRRRTDSERISLFWDKVEKQPDGCWLWVATCNYSGYGRFWGPEGKLVQAHRFSYEMANGPIPNNLQIDHLCRTRACVNPSHLDVVTQAENMRRTRAEHCRRGHVRTAESTYIAPNGTRVCRICVKLVRTQ